MAMATGTKLKSRTRAIYASLDLACAMAIYIPSLFRNEQPPVEDPAVEKLLLETSKPR